MKAKKIFSRKFVYDDDSIQELIIWEIPTPVLGSKHNFKYSLYYGKEGERIVGYDNERGKGDHKHIQGIELQYEFKDIKQLLNDFLEDVKKVKNGKENTNS